MGKIDSDYLWLHERQRDTPHLRRFALVLLVIPLMAGAAWLSTVPQNSADSAVRDDSTSISPQPDDAAQIAPASATKKPASSSASGPQDTTDNALSEHQPGASAIPVAPIDPNRTIADDGDLPPAIPEYRRDTRKLLASTKRGITRQSVSGAYPGQWQAVTVHRGDTLSIAFNRKGLSYGDSLKIAHIPNHGQRFTRGLRAGDTMRVKANAQGHVLALDYPIDALHTLQVRPRDDGFSGRIVLTDVEHRRAFASGVIDTSFYVDALGAGLSDKQIMQLVTIFGWDIDFALDIRPGDRFVVVYDELFRDGEKVGDGDILAASFSTDGRNVRAVRYVGDDEQPIYYSPQGRAMEKAFIRTPVDYTRISSGFSLSRQHPILNRIRRHEGTDYAAPSGTPIKATGDGRIVFRGRRGGYGNMIIIRHDRHLSTRYGHMSAFAKELGVGSKVRQGEVIGYVGMTGLATGPHLHYEFRVDGSPKDPEKVDLPKARPLPKRLLPDFKRQTAPLVAQLDTLSHTEVARADAGLSD